MEHRFFEEGTTPFYTDPTWYAGIERAPHLEQDGHRGRLDLAEDFVRQAFDDYHVESISDLGAGDGGLLSLIADLDVPAWGYDLMPENVQAAVSERGVDVSLANVLTEDVRVGDLSVCTEFLEHLVDPHGFLRGLSSRLVVASSPDSETPESHYEFHTYGWDMAGFRALFEQAGYTVVRQESIGFQVLLGVRE